ncbi:serine/threonine-protein kinase [Micromonospora sp. NPDC049044]|uniref:serine/threonine-protein kinase n=1 Tax=Micromonospora sp. NPDC049044 TaxID=3154827 RepID=UPI0034001CED
MQRDQLLAGRYRLLERLGSGGMSAVHRAYDEVLERDVAVKVLVASEANARQRIRAEAKAAARLSHPHVTNVYDYGESPVDGSPVPFVVMELLSGATLEQRLAAGPLPPRAGLRVCAEVASALAAAHAQELVHRDIKPSNVMLTPTGAKVLDFGIAAVAGASEIDFEGRLLGTPAYLAPERLAAGEVLPACDVYALGLLLHRVLTGRLPWPAGAQAGMLRGETHVEPDPLPEIDGVSPEIRRLYRWCVARDPADRPPAAEVARILLVAMNAVTPDVAAVSEPSDTTTDTPTVVAAGSTVVTWRRAWRWRRAVLVVGGMALAAIMLAGSLGDFANRRPGLAAPSTGKSPGTTAVAMPRTEEPTDPDDPVDIGVSDAPAPRRTAPAARTGPPMVVPGPTATAPDLDPTAPSPSTAPSTTPAPTPTLARGVAVRARGGTVTVGCVGKSVEVLAVTLADGFRAVAYDPGPASQVRVVLTSTDHRSEIRARCPNGRPDPKVQERAL